MFLAIFNHLLRAQENTSNVHMGDYDSKKVIKFNCIIIALIRLNKVCVFCSCVVLSSCSLSFWL